MNTEERSLLTQMERIIHEREKAVEANLSKDRAIEAMSNEITALRRSIANADDNKVDATVFKKERDEAIESRRSFQRRLIAESDRLMAAQNRETRLANKAVELEHEVSKRDRLLEEANQIIGALRLEGESVRRRSADRNAWIQKTQDELAASEARAAELGSELDEANAAILKLEKGVKLTPDGWTVRLLNKFQVEVKGPRGDYDAFTVHEGTPAARFVMAVFPGLRS